MPDPSVPSPAADGGRTIVMCCDGTGNEIGRRLSNILKLYRCLIKDEAQLVAYDPGVGTLAEISAWRRWLDAGRRVFGLMTGWGLDDNVLQTYRQIATHYRAGDRLCLFGFSRGAHTVRVVAALIHVVGLLRPEQLNLADYALAAFKRTPAQDDNEVLEAMIAAGMLTGDEPRTGETPGRYFGRITGARRIAIDFLGVFDTVSSVIVPRANGLLPRLEVLAATRRNPSVAVLRQAAAIDERRRMFRLDHWVASAFDPEETRDHPPGQDAKEVWFAGFHADVGGGHSEAESAIAKYPLAWMIAEATGAGIRFDPDMVDHLVNATTSPGQPAHLNPYVEPSPTGPIHPSLKGLWWLLEFIPKSVRWRQWPSRTAFLGLYIPDAEPRPIPDGALLHHSAEERFTADPHYRPVNWPNQPIIVP